MFEDSENELVELLNPFNLQEFANDKLSVLDVKAKDESGRIINIEIQAHGNKDFAQRSLYCRSSRIIISNV